MQHAHEYRVQLSELLLMGKVLQMHQHYSRMKMLSRLLFHVRFIHLVLIFQTATIKVAEKSQFVIKKRQMSMFNVWI